MTTKVIDKQPLGLLLDELKIVAADYVLVGDGSGTTWTREMGWACTVIDMLTFERTLFYGGASHGTNIVAEMMAYLHPLLGLTSQKMRIRQGGLRVHVITDCQHLVTAWNQRTIRKKNRELWAMFDLFQRRGLRLQFHWVRRATWELNKLADALAGVARINQQRLAKKALAKLDRESAYQFNPGECS